MLSTLNTIPAVIILVVVVPFVLKAIVDTIFWLLEPIKWIADPANINTIAFIKRLLSLVLGLALPFVFNVGLMQLVNIPINQYIDFIITGFMLARGSNIINDLLDILGKAKLGSK